MQTQNGLGVSTNSGLLSNRFGYYTVLSKIAICTGTTFVLTATLNATAAPLITQNVNSAGHVVVSDGSVRVHANTTGVASNPLQSEISINVGNALVYDRKINLATLSVSLVTETTNQPIVDVRLYSGGAHCCFSDLFIHTAGNASDVESFTKDWGDDPPSFVRLNNTLLLKGLLGTNYVFGPFGGSTGAIILYALEQRRLRDVTQRYPAALAHDAAQHLADYNLEAKSGRTGDASLACYLADEIRLGNTQAAWSKVQALYGGPDFDQFASKAREWLTATLRNP